MYFYANFGITQKKKTLDGKANMCIKNCMNELRWIIKNYKKTHA